VSAEKPVEKAAVKTIIPVKKKPPVIGIKKISLKRYKNSGTMIVDVGFEKELPSYGLKGEYLVSPPRYLVRAAGINKPYKRMKYTIANPFLRRIRMGLHSNPDEMHLVFDLGKPVTGNMVKLTPNKKGFRLRIGP
jgi:hypothetical protein